MDKIIEIECGKELTNQVRKRVLIYLSQFPEVFCRPPGPWVPSKLPPHEIDTGDSEPIKVPYRRIPHHLRKYVEHEIAVMLRMGVIRPPTSPWSAPILMVAKPDGTYRMCVDARKSPNSVTKVQRGQLPLIRDILESLAGKKYLSVLDLSKGYYNALLTPESCERSAFTCHMWHFEHTRVFFGLAPHPSGSPTRWQK